MIGIINKIKLKECICLLFRATMIHGVTLTTGDGLCLELDDATGAIRALKVGKKKVPLLPGVEGGFYIMDVRKAVTAAEEAPNLLRNAGFEEDGDERDLPLGWEIYGGHEFVKLDEQVYRSGKRSLCIRASGVAGRHGIGVFQQIPYEEGAGYILSGWVKSELKGTTAIMSVSCYGESDKWLKAHYFRVPEPTDWKQAKIVVGPEWVAEGTVQLRIGLWLEQKEGATGSAWFDDVRLTKLQQPEMLRLRGPVRRIGKDQLSQTMKFPGTDIEVNVRYLAKSNHILVEGEVWDTSGSPGEHALRLIYVLPIDAVGWRWGDDIRRSRIIDEGPFYHNCMTLTPWALEPTVSVYPFSAISGDKVGISLAVPMDLRAIQRTAYQSSRGFFIEFDLGLSPKTKNIGASRASFRFVLYAHDPEWCFRSCAEKYYRIFPQFFVKRAKKEGLWYYAVPVFPVPNPEDFGLTFYQGGPVTPKDWEYAKEKGIYILPYIRPWAFHQEFKEVRTADEVPPVEDCIPILNEWIKEKRIGRDISTWFELPHPQWEQAQATLHSAVHDASGVPETYRDHYAHWARVWIVNPSPLLAEPNRYSLTKRDVERLLHRADGLNIDNVAIEGAASLNYREEHFASASALSFDASVRLLLPNLFSQLEFMEWLARTVHEQGKLLKFNLFAHGAARFFAHFGDVHGGEVGSLVSGKRDLPNVEGDKESVLKRTLAYQKPVSNILQEGNFRKPQPEVTQQEIEQYIQHQMFYGFLPAISTIGGEEKPGYIGWKRYFNTPAQYERDRDLFKRYIPVLRRITEAGWEPVTYATTSDPKVWIERFGYWDKNNLHFTIRNSTPEERKVTVKVQVSKLAGRKTTDMQSIVVEEIIEGQQLAVKPCKKKDEIEFELNIKSYTTVVVNVRSSSQ